MPSLSFTSLDRLIESASSSPSGQNGPSLDRSTPFSFYPPLYATPHQQRPPSPSSFSPSPYVLNFKRRGPSQQQQNGGKETTVDDLPSHQQCQRMDGAYVSNMDVVSPERNGITVIGETLRDGYGVPRGPREGVAENEVFEMELENRDSSFCRNRVSAETNELLADASLSCSVVANEEVEFFDAPDSAFFDSASEDEVRSLNVKFGRFLEGRSGGIATRLEEEVVRRMKAEANVVQWERRWNEMVKRCASLGISLPFEAENVLGNESDALQMVNQELAVARLVSGAIAGAVVRAEKDEELDCMIGLKNREISRLWDKLQYLELVNREMSQRNLEVTEITQRRKKRRQRRRKFAITAFCAAFCIGTAGLICHKYVLWDQVWADMFHKSPEIETGLN